MRNLQLKQMQTMKYCNPLIYIKFYTTTGVAVTRCVSVNVVTRLCFPAAAPAIAPKIIIKTTMTAATAINSQIHLKFHINQEENESDNLNE